MLHFDSDYMRGAHPEVMRRLMETNLEQTVGYGSDAYTARAERLILEACGLSTDIGKVVFLTGGTQTNSTVIDSFIAPGLGVLCAETAHINVHEAGAVEYTGHKVIALPSHEGLLDAAELEKWLTDFYKDDTWQHMVEPGMVYITYPSEVGTLYSKQQLEEISAICRKYNLPLYLDGARLGYGLASDSAELTLNDIARLCDVFYIGGTKVGTLFGEAVVVTDAARWKNPLSSVKRHGALLAKGRLLGIQFETLFTDNLYLRISRNAIDKAMGLKNIFTDRGYRLFKDSPTNQQFFVMPNADIDKLMQSATFELWGPRGETCSPVRFVTDWATTDQEIDALAAALDNLH